MYDSSRSRPVALLGCMALALLLPACSWMPWHWHRSGKENQVNDCNKPQVYEQARDNAPLRIPAGLDALNTRGALRIPELHEPEAPRKLSDACLDEPPKYSATARLLPPPMTKQQRKAYEAQMKAREKAQEAEEKRKRAEEKAAKKAAKKAGKDGTQPQDAPASPPAPPPSPPADDSTPPPAPPPANP